MTHEEEFVKPEFREQREKFIKDGKKFFRNHYNTTPSKGEVNKGVSMTIPDQSLSITEIMRRYAKGLPLEGEKVPFYDEENDLPDPKSMDLVDRKEMAEAAKQEFKDISLKYQQEQNDKKAKHKAEQDKKYNEYKNKLDELDRKYNQSSESDQKVK